MTDTALSLDLTPVWLEDKSYHTAGGQRYVTIRNERGEPLALVACDEDSEEQDLAVARIMTAGSELLTVLRDVKTAVFGDAPGSEPDVYADHDKMSDLFDRVIGAIVKAEAR